MLQKKVYVSSVTEDSYDGWRVEMAKKSLTFQYWDIVPQAEILILILTRAHRERNFALYVETLESLMFLFFAFYHYNYSSWLSVHLRDMKPLPDSIKREFHKNWVVQKTTHKFSTMPIDQAHEQENSKVKGKGGVIGLTENPSALRRWIISGPEQARLLTEFETRYLPDADPEINYKHHEDGISTQQAFKQQVHQLTQTITEYGNPFSEVGPELLVLNTRDYMDDSVVASVRILESKGREQYEVFKKNVVYNRSKSIHDPLKKNSLPLFSTPKPKKKPKLEQLSNLRNNVALFGRLYIANQLRDGDPTVFFSHENQLYPPSLSDAGKLHAGKRSDLLTCLDVSTDYEHPQNIDCKRFDGGAMIHMLSTATVSDKVFLPFLYHELKRVQRIDVVWDRYLPSSIKNSTRQKRGSGVRRKVSPQTKILTKWNDFLHDYSNKEELFAFLTDAVAKEDMPENKEIYIASGESVISLGHDQPMTDCTHEEADTRVVVHLLHSLKSGNKKVVVRTVYTDIVVILVGQFYAIKRQFSDLNLWVVFGKGKDLTMYSIHSICHKLGRDKSRALPIFHAYSGCDTTSSFHGKGKKSAWGAWNAFSEATDAFIFIVEHPFTTIDNSSQQFQILERLTVTLYDRTSVLQSVNEARRELFCKNNRSIDNIPPTQDSLLQHVKRTIYQGNIWTLCQRSQYIVPSPGEWGWIMQDNEWRPQWMTLSEAAKACTELIKCCCKSDSCDRCKCSRSGLPCTELCRCICEL